MKDYVILTDAAPEAKAEAGTVGPVIGVHTGPGMISLCFEKNRRTYV